MNVCLLLHSNVQFEQSRSVCDSAILSTYKSEMKDISFYMTHEIAGRQLKQSNIDAGEIQSLTLIM